ncbi:MAG: prephenate dehydrogenase [Anaerovoracaceae bacterium]|jgi:prephenate dehydrogenase
MKIYVIGLGLMGGSLAKALSGFKGSQVIGFDKDKGVTDLAIRNSLISHVCTDFEEISEGDLIIFCTYAKHIPALLERILPSLKPGCIITDICGVKTPLYQRILPMIPDLVQYIGIHPMAGKERDGIENANPNIFENSSMLICPTNLSEESTIHLMKSIASYIGCRRIQVVDYETHDYIIAYTSNLMHAASAGLCLSFPEEMNLTFTAGAFRDCTRIADINGEAWSELLMENRHHTLNVMDTYINDLKRLRSALYNKNESDLAKLLNQAGENKREMMKR